MKGWPWIVKLCHFNVHTAHFGQEYGFRLGGFPMLKSSEVWINFIFHHNNKAPLEKQRFVVLHLWMLWREVPELLSYNLCHSLLSPLSSLPLLPLLLAHSQTHTLPFSTLSPCDIAVKAFDEWRHGLISRPQLELVDNHCAAAFALAAVEDTLIASWDRGETGESIR